MFPSDVNTTVLSVRVPNSIAEAFDARCEALHANRSAVLGGVVRLATRLGDGELRAAVKPARVATTGKHTKPRPASAQTSDKVYDQPVERREIISDTCELPADCTDDEILDGVRQINRQVAEERAAEQEEDEPAPEPAPEQLRRGAAPPRAAKRASGKRATASVTRDTLCRHLGLDPARAHGGELRRKAKAIASGSWRQKSSPEKAAALRAHLGLPSTANEDRTMAIVWSLTASPGVENPYLMRALRQSR